MIYSFVLLMPFMLLSGLTAPIGNMPEILQYFTLINPLRYAISITHQVYLEGAGTRPACCRKCWRWSPSPPSPCPFRPGCSATG